MHWNQYASPRQQKEWTRIQAEGRAKENREYRVSSNKDLNEASASKVAVEIACRVRDRLDRKRLGTKREVVVRILFSVDDEGNASHILVRMSKLDPWTPEQGVMADQVISHLVSSAIPVLDSETSEAELQSGSKVYLATAIDDTWRAAVGMAGGKPWGGSKRR